MPIYEYACRGCNGRFEELVKMNGGEPATPCPDCRSADTVRLLSSFAVGTGGDGDALATALSQGSGQGGGGCCGGACGCG